MSRGRLASFAKHGSAVMITILALMSSAGCATNPAPVVQAKAQEPVAARPGIALAPPNLTMMVQRDADNAEFASAIASRNDSRLGTPSPVMTQSDEFVRWSFQRDQVVNGLSYTDYRRTTWVRQSSQP